MTHSDRQPVEPDPLIAAFAADVVPYQSFAVARSIGSAWSPLTHDGRRRLRAAAELTEPPTSEASFHTELLWNDGDETAARRIGGFVAIRLREAERLIRIVALPGAVVTPTVRATLLRLFDAYTVRYLTTPTVEALRPALQGSGWRPEAREGDGDHVCRCEDLVALSGPRRRKARREATNFAADYAGLYDIREGRLDEAWAQRLLCELYLRWVRGKYGSPLRVPAEVRREWNAVLRTPTDWRTAQLRVFALHVAGEPVAISVVEPLWASTWTGTVFKTDRAAFAPSTALLRRHVARRGLQELGPSGLLSLQQDDGDPGLRRSKQSYGPAFLEPKFALVRDPEPRAAADVSEIDTGAHAQTDTPIHDHTDREAT